MAEKHYRNLIEKGSTTVEAEQISCFIRKKDDQTNYVLEFKYTKEESWD